MLWGKEGVPETTEADNVEQAKSWSDTRSLWYFIKMLSSKEHTPEEAHQELENILFRQRDDMSQEAKDSLLAQAEREIVRVAEQSWLVQGEGEGSEVCVHRALVLLKLSLDQAATGSLDKPASDQEIRDLLRNHRGVHGDTLVHMCVLKWDDSVMFNPDWAKNANFLRKEEPMSINARLMLWMLSFCSTSDDQEGIINNTFTLPPGEDGVVRRSFYEGETLLHMAIVRNDLELVVELLKRGADVRARATGSFFVQHQFGEFPLSFAVHAVLSLHSKWCPRITDKLLEANKQRMKQMRSLEAGRQLSMSERGVTVEPTCDVDKDGNTVLHICVYKENMDMYRYLVEKYHLSEYVMNNNNHTPLTLAAFLGKKKTFSLILQRRQCVLWNFGNITCYSEPMTEHESALVSLAPPSSLDVVVARNQVGMMEDPFLSCLVREKWQKCRATFWGLFALFCFSSTVFSFYIISDSHMGWAQNLTRVLSGAWLVSSLYHFGTVFYNTMMQLFAAISWQKVWGTMKSIHLQLFRSGLPLVTVYSVLSIYLTICDDDNCNSAKCFFVGTRLLTLAEVVVFLSSGIFIIWFFLAGIQAWNIGLYILILFRCLFTVILPFAILYIFLLIPSALIMKLIYQHSDIQIDEFQSMNTSMAKLFSMANEGMSYDDFNIGNENENPGLTSFFLLGYTLLVYILLLNLLIAVLSKEIEDISEHTELQLRMQQARIVLWIERLPLPWLTWDFLQVGAQNPSPDPFTSGLEEVGKKHNAVYYTFDIRVTLPEWYKKNEWTDVHTLVVKKMVLDACMRNPSFFKPGYMSHVLPNKTVDACDDIEIKLLELKEIKEGKKSASPGTLFYVTPDSDAHKAMIQKAQSMSFSSIDWVTNDPFSERIPRVSNELANEGYIQAKQKVFKRQLVGLPLWRSGCVATGGGLSDVHRIPSEPKSDTVVIELKLHVPVKNAWWTSMRAPSSSSHSSSQFSGSRGRIDTKETVGIQLGRICKLGTMATRLMRDSTFKRVLVKQLMLVDKSATMEESYNLDKLASQVRIKVLQESSRRYVEVLSKKHEYEPVGKLQSEHPIPLPKEVSTMTIEEIRKWNEDCNKFLLQFWKENNILDINQIKWKDAVSNGILDRL